MSYRNHQCVVHSDFGPNIPLYSPSCFRAKHSPVQFLLFYVQTFPCTVPPVLGPKIPLYNPYCFRSENSPVQSLLF
jgi:hypothetical protein